MYIFIYNLFVWDYSFEGLTFIVSFLSRTILSVISHEVLPDWIEKIRFGVIASWPQTVLGKSKYFQLNLLHSVIHLRTNACNSAIQCIERSYIRKIHKSFLIFRMKLLLGAFKWKLIEKPKQKVKYFASK